MAREQKIRLSDGEKEELDRIRQQVYDTDEVPYGAVVQHLIDFHDENLTSISRDND